MTFTKEWLQQKVSEMESRRDDPWLGLDEDESNTLEALKLALSSLEAEPVAWLLSGGGAKNNVSFDSGNAYADPLREVTPLYTAPPAPVSVPDERAAFNAWNNDTDCPLAGRDAKTAAWLAWSRRAAMLQGADGNSPVIPDGWVACSERMPHIGVPVITCSGDVVQYAAYAWDGKEWQDWYEECDKLPANTFTHWHSRPAAPQQEA